MHAAPSEEPSHAAGWVHRLFISTNSCACCIKFLYYAWRLLQRSNGCRHTRVAMVTSSQNIPWWLYKLSWWGVYLWCYCRASSFHWQYYTRSALRRFPPNNQESAKSLVSFVYMHRPSSLYNCYTAQQLSSGTAVTFCSTAYKCCSAQHHAHSSAATAQPSRLPNLQSHSFPPTNAILCRVQLQAHGIPSRPHTIFCKTRPFL